MKVLWLCNSLLPQVAVDLGIKKTKPESWISGVYEKLRASEIELCYLFPHREQIHHAYDGNVFISYEEMKPEAFEKSQVTYFKSVLLQQKPDVIHIFGTEYAHSYAMVEACRQLEIQDKVVISIQGLVSIYAKHYYAHLPEKCVHANSLRDFLSGKNIARQRKGFEQRGWYEEKAIQGVKHIMGRTDWDYACVRRINPNAKYHLCNETLRPAFYQNHWDIDKCEEHSIFVSQMSYPIKGFHLMLEAMADIVKFYPQAKLYTTGTDINKASLLKRLRLPYYRLYIEKLVKKYGLQQNVCYVGRLDEKQMCEQFVRSNVFVNCSSIENSPNSLCEAMIMGVPCVSADVGGVKTLMIHNQEGYVYQPDAPYMLAHYVMRVFEDRKKTLQMSKAAKVHADVTMDPEKNFADMINVYREISDSVK